MSVRATKEGGKTTSGLQLVQHNVREKHRRPAGALLVPGEPVEPRRPVRAVHLDQGSLHRRQPSRLLHTGSLGAWEGTGDRHQDSTLEATWLGNHVAG